MKRVGVMTALAAAVVMIAAPCLAEMCAVLDRDAKFLRIDYDASPMRGIVWAKTSNVPEELCLNVAGDVLGDGPPTQTVIWMPSQPVAKIGARRSPRSGDDEDSPDEMILVPLVVWSRHDGYDQELMYSRWDFESSTWTEPLFIEPSDNGYDDLEPMLTVVEDRVTLTWKVPGRTHTEVYRVEGHLFNVGLWYDFDWGVPELIQRIPNHDPGTLTIGSPSWGAATRSTGP